MHHFSDGLNTSHFWREGGREGGGGKGNRRMTYHIQIQLGPAHSSPVTQTACVYEPTGAMQQGISLRLCGVCQSTLLTVAMASAGKVCTSPYAQPQEQHHGVV